MLAQYLQDAIRPKLPPRRIDCLGHAVGAEKDQVVGFQRNVLSGGKVAFLLDRQRHARAAQLRFELAVAAQDVAIKVAGAGVAQDAAQRVEPGIQQRYKVVLRVGAGRSW